jgi:group I intron endonuclease
MTFYIYQVINQTNGKIYVGKTNDVHKRWTRHRNYPFCKQKDKQNECPKLYGAIRKYGISNFKFEVIGEYNSEEECCQAEVEFIEKFGSIKNGYNISAGGDGVSSGVHHPFYGKKHTIESRRKISISKIGKKMGPASEERKAKISAALIGKAKLHTKGQNNPASKLKEDDVRSIRTLISKGETISDVAKLFQVSFTAIKLIITGKTWKHVLDVV